MTGIDAELKAIGEYLDSVRQAKHISRAQLARHLGWSEKTLQRIALGDVDMKLSQFLSIMSYLNVTLHDVVSHSSMPLPSAAVMETLCLRAGAQHDDVALAQLQHQLEAYFNQYHLPWAHHYALFCQLMLAELAHDDAKATRIARLLFSQYVDYDRLTTGDFRMVTRVVGYIPYDQLRVLFSRVLSPAGDAGWSNTTAQAEAVLDTFYVSLLDSAVATGKASAVREVTTLIRNRVVLGSNYYFRMYKRICDGIELVLDGHTGEGEHLLEQVLTAAGVFIPARVLDNDAQGLRKLFTELANVH
ncbi:helix-turn-helix domain-containing protein [Lacticaseibacillus nasuensis]|uniref:HTH cro/C1-type domain-containing protein n=1 Tax=Lacticaseibacillus nasuensis JCM 17158 TaxID=1291734 RepID=A0A0R1JQZ3_9LACO|nr:helix-turn-helix transcriptional regulator [Lacticaseibacillus nasuensis]KRK71033.1 hypothetical protein FD02_GL000217 [Lacticaseibacillus nasuensis JCM 17158]